MQQLSTSFATGDWELQENVNALGLLTSILPIPYSPYRLPKDTKKMEHWGDTRVRVTDLL